MSVRITTLTVIFSVQLLPYFMTKTDGKDLLLSLDACIWKAALWNLSLNYEYQYLENSNESE
jgi:hypothetical protein